MCVVCVTAPLGLGMNGLPHWEQQDLYLERVSIMGLVLCEGVEERAGCHRANQGQIKRVDQFSRQMGKVEQKMSLRKGRR